LIDSAVMISFTLPMLGERFGSFKAVATLGSGTMGEVFLAEHQRIARRAAIKVLVPEGTRNAETVRRFFIEARVISLIHHPGIVQVYDCDVHRNGRAYIVMEYLDGETLASRLERTRLLPWTTACRITRLVAEAIGAAHEKKVIHRDLKPGNVFLLRGTDSPQASEVKVLDFGVAKLLEGHDAGGPATTAGHVLGTPEYMSPEHCSGAQVDHRSDIYSLGCVLFEMIAGAPPFSAANIRDLLTSHKFRTPPALSELAADTPPWLDRLVTRMLRKHPDQRPQTMVEVARTLAAADDDARPTAAANAGQRLISI
jgi:eukaryotic-like serine/threonine-protein kinase